MQSKAANSDKVSGVAALIFLSFVFASMGVFARYLSTSLLLFQQVYLRVLAAFLIGLVVFRKDVNLRKIFEIGKKDWTILIVRALTFYVLGVTLFTQSIIITKYSNVSFIAALPLVAVFGFVLLKEKFTIKKALLITLAFFGVALISVNDFSNIFLWGRGEILALLSTVAFSFSYIARKWQSDILNNKEITLIIFLISFVFLLPTSLMAGEGLLEIRGILNLGVIGVIIGAGIFNVMNLFLVNYGFERVKAVLASNILMLESVFAFLIAIFLYKEYPLLKELVGGIVIVASVILMNNLEKNSD